MGIDRGLGIGIAVGSEGEWRHGRGRWREGGEMWRGVEGWNDG